MYKREFLRIRFVRSQMLDPGGRDRLIYTIQIKKYVMGNENTAEYCCRWVAIKNLNS